MHHGILAAWEGYKCKQAKGLAGKHYTSNPTNSATSKHTNNYTEHPPLEYHTMSENFFDRYRSLPSKLPKVDINEISKNLAEQLAREYKRYTPSKALPEQGPVKVVQFGLDWEVYRQLYYFSKQHRVSMYSVLKIVCQPYLKEYFKLNREE